MPKAYEAQRDAMMRRGHSESEAKRVAAATFNKNRKPSQRPVTNNRKGHRTKTSARTLADARRPVY
jgi:hypothetical protein